MGSMRRETALFTILRPVFVVCLGGMLVAITSTSAGAPNQANQPSAVTTEQVSGTNPSQRPTLQGLQQQINDILSRLPSGSCSEGMIVTGIDPDGTIECGCAGLDGLNGVRQFYLDDDGDGYGSFLDFLGPACQSPDAAVDNYGDCYDLNADARPGQTQWFEVDRGDGSFDYNCDGVEELDEAYGVSLSRAAPANCIITFDGCHPNSQHGASDPAVPAQDICGTEYEFVRCLSRNLHGNNYCHVEHRVEVRQCR